MLRYYPQNRYRNGKMKPPIYPKKKTQVELMEILSGEINCEDSNQIFLDKTPIGKTDINERRKLGIETIPEERTLHATVPNLTLNENTFLTYFFKYSNTKSWITNLLNNPQNCLEESKKIGKFLDHIKL